MIPFLELTIVALSVTLGFLLAQRIRARARDTKRAREFAFDESLDRFLAGRLRDRQLLRQAATLAPESFWTVVAGPRTPWSARERRDLEVVLRRSAHVGDECRALLDSAPARREQAARRLAVVGASRVRRRLRRVMARGPEPVTLAAARALGRLRDGAALRWLLAHPAALEHRSPHARLGALRAFGPGAAPRLLAALGAPVGEPRMERAIVDALASFDCAAAIGPIADRLDHDWRDVRVAAVRALGHLGAAEHRLAVEARLADPDWRVRAQAAKTLGRFGASESATPLATVLTDPSWWVRHHAAYALFALGEEGRALLREAERGHADRYARDIAAEALSGVFRRAS